jgi:hypothetical protein
MTDLVGCVVVPARDFNDWRAYSASLLLKTNALEELPGSTVDILWQRCREAILTISRWTSGEREQEQNMSTELWNIFTEAVHLSKLLRVQRAQWSIRFPFADPSTQHDFQERHLLGKHLGLDVEHFTDLGKGLGMMRRKEGY